MTKPLIYIAGPMSKGYLIDNIRDAVKMAETVRHLGGLPIVPHLSTMWDMLSPHPYEYWMELDLELIEHCHGLIRLWGPSAGADREVSRSRDLGLNVLDLDGGPSVSVLQIEDWIEACAHAACAP